MRPLVLTLLLAVLAAPAANADLLLDLNYSDGSVAKTVFSGDTVTLDLILRDPSGDDFTPEGLGTGGGVLLTPPGSPITLTPSGPVIAGPGFDPPPVPGAPPIRPAGDIIASALVFGPILPPIPVGAGATDIVLATFSFVATGPLGSMTTIEADVFDPSHVIIGNETFTSFTPLDVLLTDLGTVPGNFGFVDLAISATPIPEPSTLMVGSLIVGGGVFWRRLRKTGRSELTDV